MPYLFLFLLAWSAFFAGYSFSVITINYEKKLPTDNWTKFCFSFQMICCLAYFLIIIIPRN